MGNPTRSDLWPGRARVFAGLVAAFATVCLAAAPAVAQGLKLDTAKEKEAEVYDKPNPHSELECTECHDVKPPEGTTAETVKFKNGEKGNVDLCMGCHDASDNVHPINMDPTKATPPIKVPEMFPLERLGVYKGSVICSTCHFIHTKTAGLKLMRGFPASSDPEDVAKAKFKDRRDLCRSCHGEGLKAKSPHQGRGGEGKKACSFCHGKEPKEGEKIQFTKNPVDLCDFCHAATRGGHFLLVNPFADPNLKEEIAKANLPMIGGEYTCVSCHNPHGGTGEEKFLRKEFVALALKSARVRPHFLKAFCEACHTVRPKLPKGAPGAQTLAEIPLRSDDPNALCNRCHESGLSKANAHPIKVVEGVFKDRIPAGWPLHNGSLTCLTCHTGGDSPVLDPANPNFLRGGPYKVRNEVCWNCHRQAEFASINPHERINKLEGCEFCHQTKPDIEKLKAGIAQSVKFKGDIVLLCIRCHEPFDHPSSIPHVGKLNKE
ncbi:MAG: hypothetical protein HY901_09490, partial [Deltaproteobacteria bacterium]|nr:hypothetical protein [Deltaproteobacteria bacterium]